MSFDADKLIFCKQLIEKKLGWGDSNSWQHHDFQKLRELILEETDVDLSESTLRRIWGKVKYEHLPSFTTLNTLAKFAGFEDWRAVSNIPVSYVAPERKKRRHNFKTTLITAGVLAIIGLVVAFSFNRSRPFVTADYTFTSRPITRSIPNSVVFEYDASAAPTDSVFIQESWDPRRRVEVDKNKKHHTSVYYEPGFYQAKLCVGDKVVKQHPLIIPSDGWMALIDRAPVPVYLDSSGFVNKESLRVPLSVILKKNFALQPDPPVVKFFNVGNFEPVPCSQFTFEAQVKNEYSDGSAACQLTEIVLITDDMPVTIPLADSGCVAELTLMTPGNLISGRNADLSGFGVDFSDWVKVICRARDNKIEYVVNDKIRYVADLPAKTSNIVGIGCFFKGSGSVKNIKLLKNEAIVFQSF